MNFVFDLWSGLLSFFGFSESDNMSDASGNNQGLPNSSQKSTNQGGNGHSAGNTVFSMSTNGNPVQQGAKSTGDDSNAKGGKEQVLPKPNPLPLVYAILSEHAYYDSEALKAKSNGGLMKLPSGWVAIKVVNNETTRVGVRHTIFQHNETKQIVVAFSGTDN